MEITIFSKKRQGRDSKYFNTFITTLTKKTGERVTMSVKFREDAGAPDPKKCPCNIVVEKHDMNIADRVYTREDTGETATAHTLWVSKWKQGGEYVDHSMDDYV